jgi:hypothetical protein
VSRPCLRFVPPILILAMPIMLQAQEEPWLSFPDTLWPCGTVTTTHIKGIDSTMVVLEELPELGARSVMTYGAWYGGHHALALPSVEGVELLPLLGEASVQEVRVVPMELLGNGRPQAIVLAMNYAGHTGWQHAIHERTWALTVWDLKDRRCVLKLPVGYELEEWTNTLDTLANGDLQVVDSEGTHDVECYDITLAPGRITLTRTSEAPVIRSVEVFAAEQVERIHYQWDGHRWVGR